MPLKLWTLKPPHNWSAIITEYYRKKEIIKPFSKFRFTLSQLFILFPAGSHFHSFYAYVDVVVAISGCRHISTYSDMMADFKGRRWRWILMTMIILLLMLMILALHSQGCCGWANLIDFTAACLHFALTFEPHWFYTNIYMHIKC